VNELDLAEAHALRDLVLCIGGRVATVGGAVCVADPRTTMSAVNRAVPVGPAVDVGAIASWYEGCPHTICVPPGYLGLEEQLAVRGYTQTGAWMKFRRAVDPPAPVATNLRVEETNDRDAFAFAGAEDMSAVAGTSGWRCFVAFDGDEPAGCGALYLDGEIAWLGIGRGAQSALLAARIEAARQLGVKRLVTETGDEVGPSYRNILRAGFAEAYLRPNYVSR
jgi:GNAT superfamily N-acetyltransferase